MIGTVLARNLLLAFGSVGLAIPGTNSVLGQDTTTAMGYFPSSRHSIDLEASGPATDAMWGHQAPMQYKILPRPATLHGKHSSANSYVNPPAKISSTPAEPYAYGWFGTKPAPQWHRQFGYQKAYTQWTLR